MKKQESNETERKGKEPQQDEELRERKAKTRTASNNITEPLSSCGKERKTQ
jgi:hypothetical protein